jgi:hypothetical protein
VAALIRDGYRELSPTHVSLEMSRLMGPLYGKSYTNEIAEWQRPDWIGRQLRQLEIVPAERAGARAPAGVGLSAARLPGAAASTCWTCWGGEDPLEDRARRIGPRRWGTGAVGAGLPVPPDLRAGARPARVGGASPCAPRSRGLAAGTDGAAAGAPAPAAGDPACILAC